MWRAMSSKRLFSTQASKDTLKTVYGPIKGRCYPSHCATFETHDPLGPA
jgi:hypothetical protein